MVLKIGAIGCSDVAKRQLFPAIDSSQLANVENIGSRSLKKAEEWAKKYGCSKFGTYDDVIDSRKELSFSYIGATYSTYFKNHFFITELFFLVIF